MDNVFNGVTDRQLQINGFTLQIPPELKAQRSIMVFNVDSDTYGQECKDMITEIMEKNTYEQDQICDLKTPRPKILKITISKINVTKKGN